MNRDCSITKKKISSLFGSNAPFSPRTCTKQCPRLPVVKSPHIRPNICQYFGLSPRKRQHNYTKKSISLYMTFSPGQGSISPITCFSRQKPKEISALCATRFSTTAVVAPKHHASSMVLPCPPPYRRLRRVETVTSKGPNHVSSPIFTRLVRCACVSMYLICNAAENQ